MVSVLCVYVLIGCLVEAWFQFWIVPAIDGECPPFDLAGTLFGIGVWPFALFAIFVKVFSPDEPDDDIE